MMAMITQLNKKQTVLDKRVTSIENKVKTQEKKEKQKEESLTKEINSIKQNIVELQEAPASNMSDEFDMAGVIKEIEERDRRSSSVMVYNLPESKSEQGTARKSDDIGIVKTICAEILEVDEVSISNASRIGKKNEDSSITRPLKVTLPNRVMRNEILKLAVKLRASSDDIASKIYISADLTPTQRQEMRQLVSEKEIRQQEEGQTDFTWIIRGGQLKRVKKLKRVNPASFQ